VLSVTNAARHRLLGSVEFAMTAPAVAAVVQRVCAVLPGAAVKVGVGYVYQWCTGDGGDGGRGWAMHRSRRIWTRTATKNQLLAQLDRCFPGLTLALPDVLGTRIGRLVAAEFADPHRLATLGVTRLCASPRIVGCGFGGQRRTGWSRPPAPHCRPRRL
jgi:hypothetical protein